MFNKTMWILLLVAFLANSCATTHSMDQLQGPANGNITYQTFYDDLSPYGTWMDYPGYGNVWSPNADDDFRPYATNGYWDYSDEGWAWMSDYSWGWAPFHYGRWLYDNAYGWLWVPGYVWSPAWVTWGSLDGSYCWAPLMPDVNAGAQFGAWRPHDFYWNVCPREHIYDRNLGSVLQRPGSVTNVSGRVTIINNFGSTSMHNQYYSRGPAASEVAQYTHRTVTPVPIRPVNAAHLVKHEGNEMHMYRPQVQRPGDGGTGRVTVPRPREFRQVQQNVARPVRIDDNWPTTRPPEQRMNVRQLPVNRVGGGGSRVGGRH